MKKLSIGEFYCGPGGLGLGASLAKIKDGNIERVYKHIFATDYDQDTCATFRKNIPDAEQVICSDVKSLDIQKLPYVDGFLYGFPCNDFSNVGETKGLDGEFGPLYSYGVKYLNHHNSKFFLAENVSGISGANAGTALNKILDELKNAGRSGYKLTVHKYKFEDYGIPQARHRFIIIGIRNDLNLSFNVPKPSQKKMSVRDALTIPPIPSSAKNQELTRQSKQVVERLSHIKAGENAWTANLPDHLKLNVKGAKMSMIYKRLDPDKPSYTITGSGGGGTHVYHWEEDRALTNRERARIQTFPDDFEFVGSKESVRKQIGMAVPVQGAKIILESILMTFAGINYEKIDANYDYD
jgi:DNA (cytosine-5)-methyltransferase 1